MSVPSEYDSLLGSAVRSLHYFRSRYFSHFTLLFPPFYISPSSPHTFNPSVSAIRLSLLYSLYSFSSLSLPAVTFQMKTLMRRISRVADSTTQYCLLRGTDAKSRRNQSFRSTVDSAKKRRSGGVPAGYVPVYVGDETEMERFLVSAELLNHPVFVGLLDRSAEKYGYEQKGALRIPCHVMDFERVLDALRLGEKALDLQDLTAAVSIDDDCYF